MTNFKKSKGFTLPELLTVLVLLGLLSAAMWQFLGGSEDKANVTVLDSQFKSWRSAADTYYSYNNMSYAGMDNTTLVNDLGLVESAAETNYAGGSNTIEASAGNIKQYTWTAAGLDSATGNQAALRYNGENNLSATYSGGDLAITVTK